MGCWTEQLGIGLVPSDLYNSAVFSDNFQYTFTLGNLRPVFQ